MAHKRQGKWAARVYDSTAGRQVWLGTFDRRKDAETVEREAKRNMQLGTFALKPKVGFADFVNKWLDTLTVRPRTIMCYRNSCRHLVGYFGNRALASITTEEIESFVAQYSRTYSPRTVHKHIVRMRQILKRAVAWGYIPSSPAGHVGNIPRLTSDREARVLLPAEVSAFVTAAPTYWQPAFLTATMTGLRRGGLFGLTWRDVLWTERQVRVRFQLYDGELAAPKSQTARRRIDVGPGLLETLALHRQRCPHTELDLVFPTQEGAPVHHSNFYHRVFKPTARAAGIPELRLHDLRHTFASALIANGQSVKYVQSVMGHASAQTTLDVYGHLFDTGGRRAAEQLEKWLGDVPGSNTVATSKSAQ